MSAAVSEAVAKEMLEEYRTALRNWRDCSGYPVGTSTRTLADERLDRVEAAILSAIQGSSPAAIPTEPLEPLLADLKQKALAAQKRAPGLWGSDIEKGEGSYGEGDEDRTGFMVPYMETEHGKRLFDAHYCDVAEIHEDYDCDDDGCTTVYAWDEAAREIFNFIAAVQPATVLKLIAAVRAGGMGMEAFAEGRNAPQNPLQPRDREEG